MFVKSTVMFTVSGENTVECLEGFAWKPHSLLALLKSFMNFETVLKGAVAVVFFRPMRNIILESLGSTGYQSRAGNPRFFGQRRGRSRN